MYAAFRLTCIIAAMLAVFVAPSAATIIQLPDNASCGGCANILFQDNDIGNPLTASTQGGSILYLSQAVADGNLFAPSNGQASVQQESGLDFHGLFMDLHLTTTTLLEFTIAPLGGQDLQNGTPADQARVTFVDNNGEVFTFYLGSVGQNRHIWQAIDGQRIVSANIEFLNGTVHAVEQIRIAEGLPPAPEPVPEAGMLLLVGSGLIGIGVRFKYKK